MKTRPGLKKLQKAHGHYKPERKKVKMNMTEEEKAAYEPILRLPENIEYWMKKEADKEIAYQRRELKRLRRMGSL